MPDAALQAMAAGIELVSSDLPVQVGDQTLEVGQSQILTEHTEIAIGSAIRLLITPGGGTSLSDARTRLQDARNSLQQELDTVGIGSTSEAADVFARRQQLEADIRSDNAKLAGLGAETIDDDVSKAKNACVTAEATVQQRAGLVEGFSPPADTSGSHIARNANGRSNFWMTKRRNRAVSQPATPPLRICKMTRSDLAMHRQALQEENETLTGLRAQLRLLLDTHGEDAGRSVGLAQLLARRTEAENHLAMTRTALAGLQPDLLDSDNTRLQRAIGQFKSAKAEAERNAVAMSMLRSDGSTDPQAALAVAEAKSRSAEEHLAGVERKAKAIQLLHQLFLEEQRALAEQFTRPLAEKITGYLQCLFGPRVQANVRLEGNAFVGLELVRPEQGAGAFAFDSLSAGAREQVAAAVRLAMAEVLAADHDNCLPLVFDDSFAYSDPDRVTILQRMLDRAATRGLQLIVLSCNPSDYAALGAKTFILRPAPVTQLPAGGEPLSDASELADSTVDVPEEPPPPGVGITVGEDQREQLLAALRAAGGSKGNMSLRQNLGWDSLTYEAVKNDLIAAGQIIPGRGKGGSLALAPDRS